jgi:hypothetical protein
MSPHIPKRSMGDLIYKLPGEEAIQGNASESRRNSWFSDRFGDKKENRISMGTRKSGSGHSKCVLWVMQEPVGFSNAPSASPNRSENPILFEWFAEIASGGCD